MINIIGKQLKPKGLIESKRTAEKLLGVIEVDLSRKYYIKYDDSTILVLTIAIKNELVEENAGELFDINETIIPMGLFSNSLGLPMMWGFKELNLFGFRENELLSYIHRDIRNWMSSSKEIIHKTKLILSNVMSKNEIEAVCS